jgi:hypothetical protein
MASKFPEETHDVDDETCVFVDAGPFSYTRLTGLSRYTARLTLALASRAPIRFFSEGHELLPSPGLNWSQDQDLQVWSRTVWRSRRRPLGPPPANSLGLYCTLRPPERLFPFEVSVLHDFSPYTVTQTHLESTPSRTRPRPMPPGSRRWTPTASSSRIPARASASGSTAIAARFAEDQTWASWSRRLNRGRTPDSSSTGS